MALRRSVEILSSPGASSGATFIREPMSSNETLIAEVRRSTRPELFCHRRQTDQLMVLRGSIDLIVLQNRCLRRITLREDDPVWVRIPPGVPHGSINRGRSVAVVVNAVLRHGPGDARNHKPCPIPAAVAADWSQLGHASSIITSYA